MTLRIEFSVERGMFAVFNTGTHSLDFYPTVGGPRMRIDAGGVHYYSSGQLTPDWARRTATIVPVAIPRQVPGGGFTDYYEDMAPYPTPATWTRNQVRYARELLDNNNVPAGVYVGLQADTMWVDEIQGDTEYSYPEPTSNFKEFSTKHNQKDLGL